MVNYILVRFRSYSKASGRYSLQENVRTDSVLKTVSHQMTVLSRVIQQSLIATAIRVAVEDNFVRVPQKSGLSGCVIKDDGG